MRLMGDRPRAERRATVDLVRENGRFAIRDDAAGYYRPLEHWEWKRLLAQSTALEYDRTLCDGVIPA